MEPLSPLHFLYFLFFSPFLCRFVVVLAYFFYNVLCLGERYVERYLRLLHVFSFVPLLGLPYQAKKEQRAARLALVAAYRRHAAKAGPSHDSHFCSIERGRREGSLLLSK
jgi:hypothetical protein